MPYQSTTPRISIQPPHPNIRRDPRSPSLLNASTSKEPVEPSKDEEPDLINLDSAKQSPVPCMKRSEISSSTSSLERILGDKGEDQQISFTPTDLPQPEDSPSKNSLKSEDSLDSLGSLKLTRIEPPEEPFQRPNSPLPGHYNDPHTIESPTLEVYDEHKGDNTDMCANEELPIEEKQETNEAPDGKSITSFEKKDNVEVTANDGVIVQLTERTRSPDRMNQEVEGEQENGKLSETLPKTTQSPERKKPEQDQAKLRVSPIPQVRIEYFFAVFRMISRSIYLKPISSSYIS